MNVNNSQSVTPNENVHAGDSIEVVCITGYSIGSTTSTSISLKAHCEANQQWSNQPICSGKLSVKKEHLIKCRQELVIRANEGCT